MGKRQVQGQCVMECDGDVECRWRRQEQTMIVICEDIYVQGRELR